ncbi:SCO2521 family protein [Streptomyces sp. NPDC021080]|uniref:SCO2521 family protein n=1 Tax=Streptomyces sp. NPDC021080 TaxID=3365110 RepID=UPI003797C7AE
MKATGEPPRYLLTCGEVRTGLLPTLHCLDGRDAARLLGLRTDERVRVSERPNLYARSPDVLTGVDCRLPTDNDAKVRAIGTVAARAVLTEGRILQATAYFSAPAAGLDQRQPWGYYLVRPGVLVPLGRLPERAVAAGFLTQGQAMSSAGELGIGSIAEGLLSHLSRHPLLDHGVPFKSRRTRLRWAALPVQDGATASIERFTLDDDGLRTVELRLPQGTEPAAVAGLCEDLALHDWLLTTVVRRLDGIRTGAAESTTAMRVMRPLVDHLLHLWMPGARVDRVLSPLWEVLETEPGFTRQWQTLVQRIRDQLTLQAIAAPSTAQTAP